MASTHNPRRSNGSLRNKVTTRVKREEHICWLCGRAVDKTLGMTPGAHGKRCTNPECTGCVPHPMRAEVDEIKPVSKGGSPFDRANCRLSHRLCNQKRSNGDPKAAQKQLTPYVNARY